MSKKLGVSFGSVAKFSSILVCAVFMIIPQLAQATSPSVSTDAASDLTRTTATLNGTISNTGGKAISQIGFQYGTDTNYGQTSTNGIFSYITQWGWNPTANGQFNAPQDAATDSSGNIYVLESTNSRIQKFDSSGTFITKWGSYGSGNGQFNSPQGIGTDSSGNVYVADYSNDRIQKFDSNGNYLTQWGSNGSGNGQFYGPQGIATDSSGNIYVTDVNNKRIQKFTSTGTYLTQWGSYGSGDGQFDYPHDITIDSNGYIYVTDVYNKRIQKFSSTGTFITKWGSNGSGDGQFGFPSGITTDSSNNIYVVDTSYNRIQKFDSSGTYQSQWGSYGTGNGRFNYPYGITIDSSDNIYVPDNGNRRIQKFDSNGTYLAQWGRIDSLTNGQFIDPTGIATDSSGNIYVADSGNNRIQKFDSSGTFITKWGSQSCRYSGFITDGNFCYPHSIAIDSSDNIYVTDSNNHRIQKFDSSGTFLSQWGSYGTGNGQFDYPTGIATDSSGNVYVADFSNKRIQKFDSNGTYLSQWGSEGNGNGQFYGPQGITIDSSDNIYVTDTYGHRIQKFDSTGTYLTQWGGNGSGNGQLSYPTGISIDSSGNVYVTDAGNHRIQKFDSNGTFITKWGGQGSESGQFSYSNGITTDSSGNVYVADTGNRRIQKFSAISSGGSFSVSLDNLHCATTYHYRALATNEDGTSYGSDATFATDDCPDLPTVITTGVDYLSRDGSYADIAYMVASLGGGSHYSSGIEYGTDTNYGSTSDDNYYYGENEQSFSYLSDLSCDTTYHYRAYAENEAGKAYGVDKTFRQPCPQPTDVSLSGRRITPKPVTAGQAVQYQFTATNKGPGDIPGNDNYSYFFINIPTSTRFVSLEAGEDYEVDCYDDEGIPGWTGLEGYTGSLIECEVYAKSNETSLNKNQSITFTLNLEATADMTENQDVVRGWLFPDNGYDDADDYDIWEEAVYNQGAGFFDVPINNIVNLTYGVNDEGTPDNGGGTNTDNGGTTPDNGGSSNTGNASQGLVATGIVTAAGIFIGILMIAGVAYTLRGYRRYKAHRAYK